MKFSTRIKKEVKIMKIGENIILGLLVYFQSLLRPKTEIQFISL